MEYMVDRRGIPMDVLTRMKIEERLEFLPQTGKEEACICFPYLEDGVMKNMKFRDAAKHFKMVKGAELIPWNIDAIKGKEKCYITEGELHRDDKIRLVREGTVIFEGELASLKRFKDDVKAVKQGYECGIGIAGYQESGRGIKGCTNGIT